MRLRNTELDKSLDKHWVRAMEACAKTGCHQMPRRSLFVAGRQLPVCARCLGAGLGGLAAIPAAFLWRPKLWQAALVAPMAVDGLTQRYGERESNNLLRYTTGWLAGFGYVSALLAAPAALARGAGWVAKKAARAKVRKALRLPKMH